MAKQDASSKNLKATPDSLYESRETIHPRHVTGIFAALRVSAVIVLMGIFYGLPWIPWDGRHAVLFDMPARKFYLFGMTLWPQDFIYLAALLIIAALSLFFFTAVAGRLWCGYACPQTVWTEVFMWIERKIEGDRNKRLKLDASAWNRRKFTLRTLKHGIWIILSLWTGYTFVGYFTPILELGSKLLQFQVGPWEAFWILFYAFATYGNAGWMREQVCMYMCPYARFQSAMFDKDTLIISYDPARGEPRGHRKRGVDLKGNNLGSCIDCQLCVQVCPTGIDIRDGLQYECIGCAACIDACDQIMEKMDYPKGLIRYTTENALETGKTNIFRPRVMLYAGVLLVVTISLLIGLINRSPLDLDVIRDRNVLYRVNNQGLIENIYLLKIINKDRSDQRYSLSVSGLPDIQLDRYETSLVKAGSVQELTILAMVDPYDVDRLASDIFIQAQSISNPDVSATTRARFLKPR